MDEPNLNFEELERKLSRSTVRRLVVGRIAEMEIGTLFFGQEISIQLHVNAHPHLKFLEELGLISRLPGHRQPFPTQLEKTDCEHWPEIQELVIRNEDKS
ncbi:MAG: hypothetical protein AAB423_03985 [Patescibacteria group bacterium]